LENDMRSKLLATAAAIALTAGAVLASSAPASAQWRGGWHGRWGWGGFGWPAAAAAGIVGGAIAAATSPLWAPGYYDYYPGYGYGPYNNYGYYNYGYSNAYTPPVATVAPGPVVAQGGDSVAYCESRFRSYDPASGTYLGFDGVRHPCP
jgi:hypothetical protein